MKTEDLEALLPTSPRTHKTDPLGLNYLFIGPPKWGKTTWCCTAPDAVLLAFERGFQFQTCPTVFIDCWDYLKGEVEPYVDDQQVLHMSMKQFMKVITVSDKYRFIIFDTADMAAKKCVDYHTQKAGAQHIGDMGDYGKGYDIAQNTPFRQMVGAVMSTGRGMAFITHSQENESKTNKLKAKRETTLPGGIHKFLHTQADIIFHGSFGVRQKGNKYRDRILQTEGDEETLAGNRTRELNIPPRFIVDPDQPWNQWCRFFEDPTAGDEATKQLAAASAKRERETNVEEEEVVKKK
jgi:hypothetical protein